MEEIGEVNGFIYLATPYWHESALVRVERQWAAAKATARLMSQGHSVFCPIAQNYLVGPYLPASTKKDWDFWMAMDLPLLRKSALVLVCRWPEWELSKGIGLEMEEADEYSIPVKFIESNLYTANDFYL